QEVRRSRALALQKLVKKHNSNCLICERSGQCRLQKICADQGLALMSQPRPNPEFTLIPGPVGVLEEPKANKHLAELSLIGPSER
ncbi:MAG: hypothetical protein LBS44_06165, partial [Deltaproteobacteria bacterium]|nr:hypothetical protein [Deltaproteobacteria bacterium]